jgi:hypothetical protein
MNDIPDKEVNDAVYKIINENNLDEAILKIYGKQNIRQVLFVMQDCYRSNSGRTMFINIFGLHHKQLKFFALAMVMVANSIHAICPDARLTRLGTMRLYDDYFQSMLKSFRFEYFLSQIGSLYSMEQFQNYIMKKYDGTAEPFKLYIESLLDKKCSKPLIKFATGLMSLDSSTIDVIINDRVFRIPEKKKEEMYTELEKVDSFLSKRLFTTNNNTTKKCLLFTIDYVKILKLRKTARILKAASLWKFQILSKYFPKEIVAEHFGNPLLSKMSNVEIEKLKGRLINRRV